MKLSDEQKAERARARMLGKARELSVGTYMTRFTAPDFQRMIRAEAAADPKPYAVCVVQGEMRDVKRSVSECACVTCGKVRPWKVDKHSGKEGIDCGHFVPRQHTGAILDEKNVAPQCQYCNGPLGGNFAMFMLWMQSERAEHIDRLLAWKHTTCPFPMLWEQVDLRIGYRKRYARAVEVMG